MNKFKFLIAPLAAVFAIATVACSNDDNDKPQDNPLYPTESKVDPAVAFPNGVPTHAGDYKITLNNRGKVEFISDGDEKATFSYKPVSRTVDYDMSMVISSSDSKETETFYFKLNNLGFVEYAYQVENDPSEDFIDTEEWWFSYNDNGQLSYMKRTEGNNETTTISYIDGNITKVETISDEDPFFPGRRNYMIAEIAYTDTANPQTLENKSGIMFFDDIFRIDLDEMEYAYFAGLLGKATKDLPVSAKETNGNSYLANYSFDWTLNASLMPTKLITTMTDNTGQHDRETYSFAW